VTDQLLRVEGIRAGYGDTTALWQVDFAIDTGTIYCLLGRNGAGKTTLASAITGLLSPSAGRVIFAGQDVTSWSPERRARLGMALVPQGRRVFPDMTVEENLRVARMAASKRARPDTPDRIMSLFPKLTSLRARAAGSLSGGEQQMLAIGRALMTEPTLLVLDEPSLGLAPRIVEDMYVVIRQTKEEQGLTMLLIEQQVGGALSVADRLGVLEGGRIVTDMPVAELSDLSTIVDSYLGREEPSASPGSTR
jgi:branched-chain amino acid transport system ATP-binding protein